MNVYHLYYNDKKVYVGKLFKLHKEFYIMSKGNFDGYTIYLKDKKVSFECELFNSREGKEILSSNNYQLMGLKAKDDSIIGFFVPSLSSKRYRKKYEKYSEDSYFELSHKDGTFASDELNEVLENYEKGMDFDIKECYKNDKEEMVKKSIIKSLSVNGTNFYSHIFYLNYIMEDRHILVDIERYG